MRRHDQAVDLLVAVIGEREHRPVLAGFAGAHLDAAHDGVGAGRGRNLDAIAFGVLQVDGVGEIDGRCIGAHVDGLDRAARREPRQLMIAKATREPQAQNLAARKNANSRPPKPAAGADRATTITSPPKR